MHVRVSRTQFPSQPKADSRHTSGPVTENCRTASVFQEYRGHADIVKGHDGRYYLVGNRGDDQPDINFWVSEDLITWKKYSDYVPDLKHVPDYPRAMARIGAPARRSASCSAR